LIAKAGPRIDCDVHPTIASTRTLFPFLDRHWQETFEDREVLSLDSISYPPNAPKTVRKDWRRPGERTATNVGELRRDVLDRWDVDIAICNCLFGVHLLYNEDMARVMASAVNDWIRQEWLDKESRLRSSIVLPWQNVEYSVAEIERLAPDRRFVQILAPAMGEMPLGRRNFWPIYAAAEKNGLPLGIHSGSSYRHPVTSLGWPTYYLEDYCSQSQGFQTQVASLICEGVFSKFPNLKVVLIESGVTWFPAFMWRLNKFWHGMRTEVPWVDRSPIDLAKAHFRLTTQPFDAPEDKVVISKIIDHLQSDRLLLFSSDYPHWQFDGDQIFPEGLSEALLHKLQTENPLETYPRMSAS
jgi:predicted TIM-barrel fold metal-dependent hydrolase